MKKVVLFLLSVFILTGCTHQLDYIDELAVGDPNIKDEIVEVLKYEKELLAQELIVIESTPVPESTQNPILIETPEPTKEPEKGTNNTPLPTKEPDPTSAPVVTVEPTVEPTPTPTLIPTPVPTPVSTPVSTPEPPIQACPGGYNPDWDCGVRIDKATPIKLFSVADYGSVEAAFAACDADGQSTNEYNGVEVRSYGCSQQTRNDYGIWGFAIYYMDVNGDIIY